MRKGQFNKKIQPFCGRQLPLWFSRMNSGQLRGLVLIHVRNYKRVYNSRQMLC